MGKYMRSKCRGGAAGDEVAAVEVTQVVGVRTRSRSASAAGGSSSPVAGGVAKRRKAMPVPMEAGEPSSAVGGAAGHEGGSCYLHLRSRKLFMAPPQKPSSASPSKPAGAALGGPLAAVLSRCSSTASSVDVWAQDKGHACRSEAAEAGGDHIPEGSASNSGGSGRDRERREETPSSRVHGEVVGDMESDLAAAHESGRSSLPAAASPVRRTTPPADEIEEFFAAAEAAQAKRFASKYNFDVVRGVPLDAAGRFEWTPVVSI